MAAAARLTVPQISSPAARAEAEQVLAELQTNLKREAAPRLIVKPTKAVKPTLTLPSAKAKPAPAAKQQETTKSTHRLCLEDQERRGTLRGFCRTELALLREMEQRK